MAINIVSQHVVSRHPGSGKPKTVQVAYNNGRIDMVHFHNNGQTTRRTIREGTTQIQQNLCVPQQIVYQRVLSRHSITNAPKIVEVKYSNGKIVRYHYHNDGRVDKL
jgi:hypothetical protein